ncbi:trypsin-like peptidase domain-containing protein [Streptomyces capitiformicae]|uniref:NACHT domain-containing protein n=1 Tax=Streptomyces capitiformicae TaxID=2014920 RepID=A0A918YX22_9ACTN|nr:trypsin-like peptidase domain-containing protein [Streptomyces capitiformicae]GHE27417.1 hypothetical protein GCM10017771_42080 [Streptomyces capitiformicae]
MTANADRAGLRPERVAEVIVAAPDGGMGRRGSGFLVAPGKVLTAAHVVEGATNLRVRFQADRPGERTVEARVAWRNEDIDIAVLASACPDDDSDPAPTSVRYGRVGDHDAVLRCTALGFPRFKLRTDDGGSRFRDAEHADATCAVLSNRREGTLDLRIASPPADDPDPERDAWEGMSGAAVFAGGRLVGVVTRHHRSEGPGRIAASRVDRWAEKLSVTQLGELESELGCTLSPSALPDAVPATKLDLIQEVYRAQLADIAPKELTDREVELRDLVEFCGGPAEYRWLQGPPWAGKTALAAWFALHPPRGVVPVWFFITARYASQSDSDAYTAALIDQLATIAGREPARHGTPTARDGERRLLLREAAERVAEQGGTLLLVVDGLDEDQSREPGGTGTSIASLLPERLPPNLRVLVTSRPSPGIPPDIKGSHPLRQCPPVELSATDAARHTEYEAKYDLQRALSGDQLERDVVGLLTAARGTLSTGDLCELTGGSDYTLRRRLGSVFGRILRLRGGGSDSGGDVTMYMTSRGYLFAHETLLSAAQDELGRDVDAYAEKVHGWAEKYRGLGWPESTPPYLLQPYGRLVTLLRDTRRAAALATDRRRHDRMREATGSDAACLAEISAAREAVRGDTPEDLGTAMALAAVGDLLARRNESLHPAIPAVYARLGRVRHAIGLARSVFETGDRAQAMAGVARALAEAGDRRARSLAEEGVRLAEQETGGGSRSGALTTRGALATVLALLGQETEAVKGLRELHRLHEKSRDLAPVLCEGLITTAEAVREPALAAELLGLAEATAEGMYHMPNRIRVLVNLAEAWSARGLPESAKSANRLYGSVVELACRHTDDSGNLLAMAAHALHGVRPAEADRLISLVEGKLSGPFGALIAETATYSATFVHVVAGRLEDAEQIARDESRASSVVRDQDADYWYSPWMLVAEGWARRGCVYEAWAALLSGELFPDGDGETIGRIVALLVESGAVEQLEALLLDGGGFEPPDMAWDNAEALAVLAGQVAEDDPQRSMALLRAAEHGLRPGHERLSTVQQERFAAFAGALAAAGRLNDAEWLLEDIDDPDACVWGCAALSLAVAREHPNRALELAERSVERGRRTELSWIYTLSVNAVQALAWAGAGQRVAEVIEELAGGDGPPKGFDHHRARGEAAAGLWAHDPEMAGRLVDEALPDPGHAYPTPLAHLLAAVGPYDHERGARIREALLDLEHHHDPRDDYGVLYSLLTATSDPVGARRRLAAWSASSGAVYLPEALETGGGAVAHAALGDHETAWTLARQAVDEERRAEAFAHLAAYVACVPADRLPVPLHEDTFNITALARRLATLLAPPSSGPDLPQARALLSEALTPDGWHHAAPVLAAIDPEAVFRVRDVLFAYLGLTV